MQKKFESKTISEATPEQLRGYAAQFLGIDVNGASDAQVLAKVKAANDGDTIFVATAPEETDQTGSPPPNVEGTNAAPEDSGSLVGSFGRADPKVQLTLHAEERDGVVVSRHKEVSVNGRAFLLKRGESITIPYRIYMALANAERDAITHDKEGNVVHQKVKNTPYNVEVMPSPAEIAAWEAQTNQELMP